MEFSLPGYVAKPYTMLDGLYSFATNIMQSACNVEKAGVAGSLLYGLEMTGNGSMSPDPKSLLKSSLISSMTCGGYIGGYLFGLLFIIIALFIAITLCIRVCCPSSRKSAMYRIVSSKMRVKKQQIEANPSIFILQMIVSTILLILTCLALLGFILSAIYMGNTLRGEFLSSMNSSLGHSQNYLENFYDINLKATNESLNNMIKDTKAFQLESSKKFNGILQAEMKASTASEAGGQLTDIMVSMFEEYEALKNQKKELTALSYKLLGSVSKSGCGEDCTKKAMSISVPSSCDEGYGMSIKFLNAMSAAGKSRDTVLKENQMRKDKMAERDRVTRAKSDARMQTEATLRNSTLKGFKDLSDQMYNASLKIKSIRTVKLESVDAKLQKMGLVVSLVLAVLSLIFIMSIGLVIYAMARYVRAPNNLSDVARIRIKGLISVILWLLIICLICSGLFYISHGAIENNVCRYIRIEERNEDMPYFDKALNHFIDTNWDAIEKTANAKKPPSERKPLPHPKNIVQGITSKCYQGKGLLDAINSVESLQPAKMGDPRVTEHFIKQGHGLLIESLNELDAEKEIPEKQIRDLADADKLIDMQIRSTNVDQCSNDLTAMLDKVQNLMADPKNKLWSGSLKPIVERMEKMIQRISGVKSIPNVAPIINTLKNTLPGLKKLMADKPKLLDIGERLFEKHVINKSAESGAKIANEHVPKLFRNIGKPCTPIYRTFNDLSFGLCSTITYPISGLWFFGGLSCIGSILMLLYTLFILPKMVVNDEKHYDGINGMM